uniref:Uncharacterized protein n=1 Tax=Serinus canaria TaxID=9135 RepID=A0A8C9NPD2_SERCA
RGWGGAKWRRLLRGAREGRGEEQNGGTPRPHRILGLCNNLPYVVMLSAARDLLEPRPVSSHAHF